MTSQGTCLVCCSSDFLSDTQLSAQLSLVQKQHGFELHVVSSMDELLVFSRDRAYHLALVQDVYVDSTPEAKDFFRSLAAGMGQQLVLAPDSSWRKKTLDGFEVIFLPSEKDLLISKIIQWAGTSAPSARIRSGERAQVQARKFPRALQELPIELRSAERPHIVVHCQTRDFGEGGVCVKPRSSQAEEPIPGELFRFRLQLTVQGLECTVSGLMVARWNQFKTSGLAGFEFQNLSPEAKSWIREVVSSAPA